MVRLLKFLVSCAMVVLLATLPTVWSAVSEHTEQLKAKVEALELILKIDKNEDGRLSKQELEQHFDTLDQETIESKRKKVAVDHAHLWQQSADENKDGILTQNELQGPDTSLNFSQWYAIFKKHRF
jgi:hypothetical protein